MKIIKKALICLLLIITAVCFMHRGSVHAATFNPSDVIDDGVFNNSITMNSTQINSWLDDNFPNSCVSPNHGFSAPDPTGYSPSNGFTYGGNASAGQVFSDAAQAYGINPEVLIATVEKEQGLVSGSGPYGCSALSYSAAAGYGCPDGAPPGGYSYSGIDIGTVNGVEITSVSGTCVNTAAKAGFSQQVIHAAWLLRFAEQRSEGNINWNIQLTNQPQSGDLWDNSDDPQSCYDGPMTQGTYVICPGGTATYYDGYDTIDGSSTLIDNGATAALYFYTPHFSGNEDFDTIFDNWFGSTYNPDFQATFVGQSAYPTIIQGQSSSAYFRYQNTGNEPWYDDVSAPQYNTYPVHLATSNPLNIGSPFSAFWPTRNRATGTFAHVYQSDGVTLASNQHVALPGQIVEFDFSFSVSANTAPGYYPQYFQPILEGSSLWNMGGEAWLGVTVQKPTFQATFTGESSYPTMARGSSSAAYFRYQNTGNEPWYDDVSAPQYNTYPVHLATSNPLNIGSPFSAFWPTRNRATGTFAHVYQSDGVTLASNQHVALPGQIVEFDFSFSVSANTAPGYYPQYFQPILEGSSLWNMGGEAWLGVTVQ